MQVIGVVGFPASGKGEFSRIAKEMKIPVVTMGDVIRKAVTDAGLTLNDKNMGEMSRCLRQGMGMDALAKLSVPLIEDELEHSKTVLVDGIRGDSEVLYFQNIFKNFNLIAVDCPFETRLERLKARGRSDDSANSSVEGLKARDDRERGWGLEAAIGMAEYVISNEGTMEEFEAAVKKLIKEIQRKPVDNA